MTNKPLSRHHMNLAIAAVEQVKAFIEDSGMDATGERGKSLSVALDSLQLIRRHWTTGGNSSPTSETESTPPALNESSQNDDREPANV